MNDRTMPANDAALSTHSVDLQDLRSRAMDRAIGNQKKKASWFAPLLGHVLGTVVRAFASCVESPRNWLTLRPRASSHVGPAATNPGAQAQPTAEVLERSMDIVIGTQYVAAPRSTVAASLVRKAQPLLAPDQLAYSMDIAIGERFTVAASTVVDNPASEALLSPEVPQPIKELAVAARAGH